MNLRLGSAVAVLLFAPAVFAAQGVAVRAMEGTVKKVDAATQTVVVKTADGAEATFRLTDRAATDAGEDIGKGAEKTGKVTVYYTEETGHKVAHFFKKVF